MVAGLAIVPRLLDKINSRILVSPDTSPRLKEAWTGRALPLVQKKETEVSKTKLWRAYGSQLLRPWLFHPSVRPIDHRWREVFCARRLSRDASDDGACDVAQRFSSLIYFAPLHACLIPLTLIRWYKRVKGRARRCYC